MGINGLNVKTRRWIRPILFFLIFGYPLTLSATQDSIAYRHKAALSLNPEWAFDAYWKNPRVERTIFHITLPDGKEGSVTHLVEAEWTDAVHLVKPQDLERTGSPVSGENFHSMEFHALYDYPRTFATYRAFMEILFDRHSLAPVKWQYAFHDTCGVIYKTIHGNTQKLSVDSYWEGRKSFGIPSLEGVWFSDGLPLSLRALPLTSDYRNDVKLLLNERDIKTDQPNIVNAKIEVVQKEVISTPAGQFECFLVRVHAPGFAGKYWLDQSGTHPLIRFEVGEGNQVTKYVLKQLDIIDYATE